MLPWSSESPGVWGLRRKRWGLVSLGCANFLTALLFFVLTLHDIFAGRSSCAKALLWETVVLGVTCVALSAFMGIVLWGLACWKEVPVLLGRRSKSASKRFMCSGCINSALGVSVGIWVASQCDRWFWRMAGSFLCISCCSAGMVLCVIWLIDLETNKPADVPYDSLILFYARCLCWSDRQKKLVFAGAPIFLLTFVSGIYLAVAWEQDGSDVCSRREWLYLLAATCLMATHSLLVGLALFSSGRRHRFAGQRFLWCSCRSISRAALAFIILSSILWGSLGSLFLFVGFKDCGKGEGTTFHIAWAMHVLLLMFGCLLLCFSTLCKVEALLFNYYVHHEQQHFANGFNQLMLGNREFVLSYEDLDTDTEGDDGGPDEREVLEALEAESHEGGVNQEERLDSALAYGIDKSVDIVLG